MPLKFCANLSFMFQETSSLLERYSLARKAGFAAVECAFPYEHPVSQVVGAKQQLRQVLINIHVGDVSKGELGTASHPGKEETFKRSLELAVEYARALDCNRVHIMSGTVQSPGPEHAAVYESNLRFAAEVLARHDIVGLIEPINNISVPNYYMNSYERAMELISSIDSPHLKLMMDLFHLQHLKGNLTHNIAKLLPHVGHIQVAQVPDRHEPDSAGEVNYAYVFSLLEKLGYDQWIGLEYRPRGDTIAGLQWVTQYGYQL